MLRSGHSKRGDQLPVAESFSLSSSSSRYENSTNKMDELVLRYNTSTGTSNFKPFEKAFSNVLLQDYNLVASWVLEGKPFPLSTLLDQFSEENDEEDASAAAIKRRQASQDKSRESLVIKQMMQASTCCGAILTRLSHDAIQRLELEPTFMSVRSTCAHKLWTLLKRVFMGSDGNSNLKLYETFG